MKTVPLIGYTNTLSGRPGQRIEFKVSSKLKEHYSARLYKSINADPNPALGGVLEEHCDHIFKPISLKSREQKFFPGSFGETTNTVSFSPKKSIKMSCVFYPTLLFKTSQCLVSLDDMSLIINTQGKPSVKYDERILVLDHRLSERKWYEVSGEVFENGRIAVEVKELENPNHQKKITEKISPLSKVFILKGKLTVAAELENGVPTKHFNGKIEAPFLQVDETIKAAWNFSNNMSSTLVSSKTPFEIKLINFPMRAVRGSKWDGSEMNWTHKPEHYAAIHFHEDDIYDFEWKTDFSFLIPEEMESGIYVMRLQCGNYEDAIPFFVCPAIGTTQAKICVLVSTFTYSVYGNHARPDYSPEWQKKISAWSAYPYNPAEYRNYGLSTYNYHSDGTGICYASTNRPLFNLKPGYLTFGNSTCSGLRHFQADSHLISWFYNKKITFDIITDNELHNEGIDAIKDYASVTTGTHPEYHTVETLDALKTYRDSGGALNYLGGNGFYWKIARHKEKQDVLEIRRAEDGIRAWASEPGEYYNSFDGNYGGLWRRNGRPPQQLVGVGFTAQGIFVGMPYKRTYFGKELNWIFDGIDENIIGDFGYSGHGAAGFELDRVDKMLDEGHEIEIIAQSHDTGKKFMLVPEEQLTHLTNVSGGPEDDIRRADMVFFKVAGGGTVFSTGSITFCGSLPWNNFDNNVSKLLYNIISRSIKN